MKSLHTAFSFAPPSILSLTICGEKIIMIRALQKADIDSVTDIWLDTNLKAHDSIPTQYWNSNYDLVK